MILVTGVAGFIGSHLTEALLRKNYNVIGIDNFDPYYDTELKLKNLSNFKDHENFTLIRKSICDHDLLKLLREYKIEAIIHIAAKAGVRPSLENPNAYYQTNVNGTLNLLEISREMNVKKFLFASSSSVYGENPERPWSEGDADLNPISPYAATKLACEQMGHVYSKLYEVQFLAMRFFTVFGPRQRPDLAIRKFIELILADKPIPLFGDGSTSRDYTYVADTVDGIIKLLETDFLPAFDIFNLGNETPVTLNEMVNTIANVLGKQPDMQYLPMQPGDVSHTLADISKAKNSFAYQPQTSFEEGIQEFLKWHQKQDNL